MRGFWVGLGALALGILLVTGTAQAKDLSRRLGVGYSDQFGTDESLPSVALRYYPNGSYGLMGALGVDTEKNASRFGIMGKVIKIIFREDNLNFYTAASAGLISEEENSNTDSGFDIAGVVGTEFFFAGLENVGFSFEAGVGVTSISSEVRFRTIGDHPLNAGIMFYF